MTEIIPTEIDGAVVCSVWSHQPCGPNCDQCWQVVVGLRNWLQESRLRYAVFDFMDIKYLCEDLVEELVLLRKRIRIPFLYSGVSLQARKILSKYPFVHAYPMFLTPEDAVRALRIDYPVLTEGAFQSIRLGAPIGLYHQAGLEQAEVMTH